MVCSYAEQGGGIPPGPTEELSLGSPHLSSDTRSAVLGSVLTCDGHAAAGGNETQLCYSETGSQRHGVSHTRVRVMEHSASAWVTQTAETLHT